MNWNEGRATACEYSVDFLKSRVPCQLRRQPLCCRHIAGLGSLVFSVPLNRALRRRKDDGRKTVPGKPMDRSEVYDKRIPEPLSQDIARALAAI